MEYECVCERECLALRRRAKQRSDSDDAALRACLSKEDVEEGRAPSERVATCETTSLEDKNKNGVGKIMRAVWGGRS